MSKMNQLQLLQQNLQNLLQQKQQLESQVSELESALQELQKSEKAYKIVGKIMISRPKAELLADLNEKKELTQVRLQHIQKQEGQLQKRFEEVQKEVVAEMKKKS